MGELKQRLRYLDGMRGLAIALVVVFHAYARWPQFVGSRFADTPMAQGKVGVQLFFLISGYVIFMSLEKSAGVADFLRRRWLRLFPGMLIASLLLYLSAPLLFRPLGQPVLRDLLPGLTFIGPHWWEAILRSPQGELEGSFWSLYVEFKFYVVVSLLYFGFSTRTAMVVLIAGFTASLVAGHFTNLHALGAASRVLGAEYWGWFAAGALHYRFAQTGQPSYFFAAIAVSVIAAFQVDPSPCIPAAICMALVFAAAQVSDTTRALLSNRVLLFLGFVSYPLYLVHENTMVAAIVALQKHTPTNVQWLLPAVPIAGLVAIAWLIASHAEPRLARWLGRALTRARPAQKTTARTA